MKRAGIAVLLGIVAVSVTAESAGNRAQIVRTGMITLGSWATLNLVGGTVGALTAEDAEAAGFWEMNALWNSVNLALAGGTLVAEHRRTDASGATEIILPAYREESHRLEKILLFNAGLDVGYMAVGAWLWDRGSNGRGLSVSDVDAARLTGWGQSLVVQGAFLFVFDLVMARVIGRDRDAGTPTAPR